jgi:citrate lyase subunit beta/citryl-CoA lyase
MVANAAKLDADEIFLDLEDAVGPDQKVAARAAAVAALLGTDFRAKVRAVRVNAMDTPLAHDDIVGVVTGAGDRLDTLIVPKVEDESQVRSAVELLGRLERDHPRARPVGLELLIESTLGVSNLRDILRASPRIEAAIFGVGDYSVSLGLSSFDFGVQEAGYPGHQWHWVMSEIANEAWARGIQAIDGPYVDFKDEPGFTRSATMARLLGYSGKWCIHPNQIPWGNAAFGASPAAVARARAILSAYREALGRGAGAVAIDGVMIDEATRKAAERVVANADVEA